MSAIKPCPFCGNKYPFVWQEGYKFFVVCPPCNVDGPVTESAQKAIELWNKREPDWERKWGELVEVVALRTDQARAK